MANDIRVTGTKELRRLAKDLKKHVDGKDRRRHMLREFRSILKPVKAELKASIARMPSKGHGPRKGRKGTLRSEMARAVTTQVSTAGSRTGASVFMSPKKMPNGAKSLPAYFERVPGYENLRHPVYGRWLPGQSAQKVPHQGYFTRTVDPLARKASEAATDVVEKVVRELES